MLTKADIEKYFVAEKHESLLFVIVGLACMLLGIIFFTGLKTSFYKGAAIPLLLIGLLQALAGYVVYNKSDDQRISNVYAYDMNPDQLRNVEWPRIRKINKNFIALRAAEGLLCIAGIVIALLFRNLPLRQFWFGFGITLALQSAVLIVADSFAARRAAVYETLLGQFANNHPPPSS